MRPLGLRRLGGHSSGDPRGRLGKGLGGNVGDFAAFTSSGGRFHIIRVLVHLIVFESIAWILRRISTIGVQLGDNNVGFVVHNLLQSVTQVRHVDAGITSYLAAAAAARRDFLLPALFLHLGLRFAHLDDAVPYA